MTATDPHAVPQWKLERFVLGELPAAELSALRTRVEADADLQQQVQALRDGNADVLQNYPAPWMARQIQTRSASAPVTGRSFRWNWSLVPVAAAALLAIIAVPRLQNDSATYQAPIASEAGVRIKGDAGPALWVHRRLPDGTEQLSEGAVARSGDLLRLQYDADGAGWGVIVSLDGRGAVTRHLPTTGSQSVALTQGQQALADAYELDDAPDWERFYFVTAEQPFPVGIVVDALRTAGRGEGAPERIELPDGLQQMGITLIKSTPGADR